MDDKLKVAVNSVKQQQSFSQLQEQNPNIPTDYSLMLLRPDQDPFPFGGSKDSHPDIDSLSPADAKRLDLDPFQVRGTDGRNWRVVALNVLDGNQRNAVVIIGLPLAPWTPSWNTLRWW